MPLLETKDLGIAFGGLQALDDVYITVDEKEIVGLIGPNGAGKTTVFNLLTGVYTPTKGAIRFEGKSILGRKPYQINRLGIARTFQNIRLFKNMTVMDNIKVAMNQNMRYTVAEGIFRLPRYWKEEKKVEGKARELLQIFGMEDTADQMAANLPYGQQRKLEILRALASKPKLLLLDEPAAGMNPTETHDLMETIQEIRDMFGVGFLSSSKLKAITREQSTKPKSAPTKKLSRPIWAVKEEAVCLTSPTSTSTTAPSTRSRACPFMWKRGKSSPSSGPMAPEKPPPCRPFPACCAPKPATSPSWSPAFSRQNPIRLSRWAWRRCRRAAAFSAA